MNTLSASRSLNKQTIISCRICICIRLVWLSFQVKLFRSKCHLMQSRMVVGFKRDFICKQSCDIMVDFQRTCWLVWRCLDKFYKNNWNLIIGKVNGKLNALHVSQQEKGSEKGNFMEIIWYSTQFKEKLEHINVCVGKHILNCSWK